MRSIAYLLACLGAATLLWLPDTGQTAQVGRPDLEDAPVLPEGLEVQTRGPIHEAYAQPVIRDPEEAPLVREQPPEPVPELPPELKPEGENVVWIPGYWAWESDAEQFLWVSGLWRNMPPDRTWVPGYWHRNEGGHQWTSGYWSMISEPEVTIVPPPPEPIPEAIPLAPDAESTFIPGCWMHVENRFYWRPGHWIQYRPGWTWSPACYYWTPAGHVFVDGFWDHDFHHRGLMFAPVRFANAGIYQRAGYFYRPRHVVQADFLLGSLFVRGGGYRSYYFGDYYEPRYAKAGFTPWANVRLGGGRYYDPLFNYYRWNYRDQPRWEENLRTVYEGRRAGTVARPPRTYNEQLKLATTKNAMQVAVPLERYKSVEKTSVRLTSVTKTEVTQITKRIEDIQTLRTTRSQVEAKVRAKGGAKSEAVRMELPRIREEVRAFKGENAPPPRPTLPKAFAKPFEGKIGEPKGKDLDPFPKGKDKLDPFPKGKDKLDPFPKGKDKLDPFPKGKDIDVPFPKGKDKLDPFPKGKDIDVPFPKDKDKLDPFPKGKDKFDPFPKGKDIDVPFPKDKDKLDPFPKGKDKFDPFPKGKDIDVPFPKGKDKLDPFPKGKDPFDPIPKGKNPMDPRPKGKGKGKDDVITLPPQATTPPGTPKVTDPRPPVRDRDDPLPGKRITPPAIEDAPPRPPVTVPPKTPAPLPKKFAPPAIEDIAPKPPTKIQPKAPAPTRTPPPAIEDIAPKPPVVIPPKAPAVPPKQIAPPPIEKVAPKPPVNIQPKAPAVPPKQIAPPPIEKVAPKPPVNIQPKAPRELPIPKTGVPDRPLPRVEPPNPSIPVPATPAPPKKGRGKDRDKD